MKLDFPTHVISSECHLLNANCRKAEIVISTRLKQLQILLFFDLLIVLSTYQQIYQALDNLERNALFWDFWDHTQFYYKNRKKCSSICLICFAPYKNIQGKYFCDAPKDFVLTRMTIRSIFCAIAGLLWGKTNEVGANRFFYHTISSQKVKTNKNTSGIGNTKYSQTW